MTLITCIGTVGTLIGMSGKKLNIIMSGDSAYAIQLYLPLLVVLIRCFSGATLAVNVVIKILEHNNLSHLSSHHPTILPQPLALVLNYAALDFNFTSWMSPDHLRVLRSEQSSGNLPGLKELAAQKDHLKHVSPLSMVGDKRPGMSRGKRLKRRTSWKDTIRGLTSGNEKEEADVSPALRTRRSMSIIKSPSTRSSVSGRRERSLTSTPVDDKGALADAESSDEEDFDQWKEEDRPIQARVRHVYHNSTQNPVPIPWNESVLEKQQQELSVAVAEANTKATLAVGGKELEKGKGKEKEPIGTRLTMTSRTGYFQDRIVSPSMVRHIVLCLLKCSIDYWQMRAMAILYIGPHRNPDFATDYYISPILTPTDLLAQFPPLLMQCGEKDPFVDDTVIFAGRVREAKRARKIELDLAISGKSARFGETLRMSIAEAPSDGGRLVAMKKERDKLSKESEDDWVQMVLFSDWSHGYLQMNTLMSEAKTVIEELAEWIDDAFGRHPGDGSGRDTLMAEPGKKRVTGWDSPLTPLQPTDPVPSRRSQSPITSETETEDSGITFVPKKHYCCSRANSFDADRVTSTSNSDTGPAHRVDSSGSDATLLDNHIMTSSSKPPHDHAHDVVNESRHDLRDLRAPLDNGYDMYSRPQTPEAGTGKSSGQRQKGQTITETEMMRRRRLLDAHIFD